MANTFSARAVPAGEAIIAASRQVWLASLGAAVVTREWAQNEAGALFRTLVKEGTAIESRTFRLIGETVETSFTKANSVWHQARSTMTHAVKQYAETATTLVRETLPRNLPKVELPGAFQKRAGAKRRTVRATKAVKSRTGRTVKAAKRGVKRTAKRATKSA